MAEGHWQEAQVWMRYLNDGEPERDNHDQQDRNCTMM
jgi:hypothetical protein